MELEMRTISSTSMAAIVAITVAFILTAIVQVITGLLPGLEQTSISIAKSILAGVILIFALRCSHFEKIVVRLQS